MNQCFLGLGGRNNNLRKKINSDSVTISVTGLEGSLNDATPRVNTNILSGSGLDSGFLPLVDTTGTIHTQDDDEISNLVDLHMGMFDGRWKQQDLQGLLWLDHLKRSELMGYVDDSEMPMYCGGRGGSVGSNSGVGERKVEFMGRIGGGSFAKTFNGCNGGLRGDGFVVDGGRSSSKSRKDEEDGGVENKSSMGSRLIATGELIVGDSGGVIIREVGGAPEV
ncbi:hypothetical protein Tco_1564073 [Tanacetum coccineum]